VGKELRLLTALGMRSFLNLNTVFHTTDPKRKRRAALLAVVGGLLVLCFFFYIGVYTYALCSFGMETLVLPWLFLLSSVLVFAVGLFHTGGTLFERRSYDILGSLPLRDSVLVGSRFLCCYLESLLYTLGVLLPSLAVYGYMVHPNPALVLRFLLCAPLAPLLPLSLTVLFSTALKLLSGRMRNRSLVEAGASLLLIVLILYGETLLRSKSESISTRELVALSALLGQSLERLYPLCGWFARFCEGELLELCKLIAVSFGISAVIFLLTVRFFRPVSLALGSTARRKGREAVGQSRGLLFALLRREWKRYLSSSIYVTNTAVGPLLALMGSAALLFVDAGGVFPANVPLAAVAPFGLCTVLCMMPPASVSVSMEGRQRWITKTLPIPPSVYLDAKLLMTLSFQLPCALLSSLLLCCALKPGIGDGIFLFLLPPLLCLFTATLALTADIHLGSTEWEKEVTVVKQSASAMVGGFGGMLLGLAGAFAAVELSEGLFRAFRLAVCVLLPLGTALLRQHNVRKLR